jgi:hypothetical protein
MRYWTTYCRRLDGISALLSKPLERARKLRGDESGNVLLLSGMMAFLFTIFALVSADTSQAIYNRIIAQNSVDAAAEAAALWQARGCNLIQNLNNYHYDANQFFAKTEATALNSCVLAGVLRAGSFLPVIGPACAVASRIVCVACDSAPVWDDAQCVTAAGIVTEQKLVVATIPFVTLAAANDAAQGSGADEFFPSAGNWVNQVGSSVGIDLSGLPGVASKLNNLINKFGLTIYALPMDPTSLELGMKPAVGNRSPWNFGPCLPEVRVGQIICGLSNPSLNLGPEKHNQPGNWGWVSDQYYTGQPGYMTWIAAKNTQPELAGLGFLRWLNPNPEPPAETSYWMNQWNLPLYRGSVRSSGNLVIPAYIALASSQVDGAPKTKWTGVGLTSGQTPIAAGAYPYLIPVYIPRSGSPKDPIQGTSLGIFH